MNLDEFNVLFEQYVEAPLLQVGFERYRKSRTLVLTDGNAQLSLIRLGGRLSRPGHIAQVLCFRHVFLRPMLPDEPVAFSLEPNDYPFKLSLAQFAGAAQEQPHYQPMNLGRWPIDYYRFADSRLDTARRDLTYMKDLLTEKGVPWCSLMTPEVVADQIRAYGEAAWCEERCLEDYKAHLSNQAE